MRYHNSKKLIISIILLICGIAVNLTAQIKVNLPENPSITSIAPAIRGYHQGDFYWVDWNEIDYFTLKQEFAKLLPGIIRWPGGTNANNYIWQNHLNDDIRFNLIKVVDFIRDMNISLQYMVNFGNGSASDAANFTRLCRANSSYWQNERASLFGSTEPVDLKFCEIGNESDYSHAWVSAWFGRALAEKIYFRNGSYVNFPAHTAKSLYFYGGNMWRCGWVEGKTIEAHHHKTEAILGEKYLIQSDSADTIIVPVSYPKIGRDSIYVWAVDTTLTENDMDFMSVQEIYNLITDPKYSLNSNYFTIIGDSVVKVYPPMTMNKNELIYIEYQSVDHNGAFAFRDSIKAVDPTVQVGYSVWPDSLLLENNSFRNDFVQSPPDFIIRHTYPSTKDIQWLVDNGHFSEIPYLPRHIVQQYIIPGHAFMDSVVADFGLNRLGIAITEWSYGDGLCPDCNMEIYDGVVGAIITAMFAASYMEATHNSSINLVASNFHILVRKWGDLSIFNIEPNSLKFIVTSRAQALRMLNNTIGTKFFTIDSTDIFDNPLINILTKNFNDEVDTISIPAVKMWGGIDSLSSNYCVLLINQDDSLEHSISFKVPTLWAADSVFIEKMTGAPDSSVFFVTKETFAIVGDSVEIILPAFSLTALRFGSTNTAVQSNQPPERAISLASAYPNPFNSSTQIHYCLPFKAHVSLVIYNTLGQKVRTLVNTPQQSGKYLVTWNGIDDDGRQAASGIYLYQLQTKNRLQTKRMVLLR